jgi:hypothetical protein
MVIRAEFVGLHGSGPSNAAEFFATRKTPFLWPLDQRIVNVTVLPCSGGFFVTECYGNLRTTGDFDILDVATRSMSAKLIELAERGSWRYPYIDVVGVASMPYEYESR